jgi:hypothetical protein
MTMYVKRRSSVAPIVRRMAMRTMTWFATVVLVPACSPASLVDVAPANTVIDPSTVKTAAAAQQLYNNAVAQFYKYFGSDNSNYIEFSGMPNNVIVAAGVFTDELQARGTGGFYSSGLDERTNSRSVVGGPFYGYIQATRASQLQAREALARYAPNLPKAMQGQMQAYEGYTVLWLAELFCSGVPLSKQPLEGSTLLTGGLSTDELLQAAAALFDSAMVAGADSASLVNLAKVGKGRALLGQGQFDAAAAAVHDVPTDFVAYARFNSAFDANFIGYNPSLNVQVVDHEGTNGLVWSTDPRAAVTTNPAVTGAMQITAKYSLPPGAGAVDAAALQAAATVSAPNTPIRVADGVEARLIEAEAALRRNDGSWLTILNTLRSTCVAAAPCATAPGIAANALPPLVDPGNDSLRIDTLFHERAKWLFLTGHREGDLRRLVRFYHRRIEDLWPVGTYSNPGFPPLVPSTATNGSQYGVDVVFEPTSEAQYNPKYHGCISLDP